jgi:hypothetical protein
MLINDLFFNIKDYSNMVIKRKGFTFTPCKRIFPTFFARRFQDRNVLNTYPLRHRSTLNNSAFVIDPFSLILYPLANFLPLHRITFFVSFASNLQPQTVLGISVLSPFFS